MLLATAFWQQDVLTRADRAHVDAGQLCRRCAPTTSTGTITLRTVGMAAAVTITDAILAFPLAYYMVRDRVAADAGAAVRAACSMPLWSSYLVQGATPGG